jgi:hypothetical protein
MVCKRGFPNVSFFEIKVFDTLTGNNVRFDYNDGTFYCIPPIILTVYLQNDGRKMD